MRSRPRNVNPSPWRVQAELAGLKALHGRRSMRERIENKLIAGARAGFDGDAIIRERRSTDEE